LRCDLHPRPRPLLRVMAVARLQDPAVAPPVVVSTAPRCHFREQIHPSPSASDGTRFQCRHRTRVHCRRTCGIRTEFAAPALPTTRPAVVGLRLWRRQ
jgi:hypothetical protein